MSLPSYSGSSKNSNLPDSGNSRRPAPASTGTFQKPKPPPEDPGIQLRLNNHDGEISITPGKTRVATLSALYSKLDFFSPVTIEQRQKILDEQNRIRKNSDFNPSSFHPPVPSSKSPTLVPMPMPKIDTTLIRRSSSAHDLPKEVPPPLSESSTPEATQSEDEDCPPVYLATRGPKVPLFAQHMQDSQNYKTSTLPGRSGPSASPFVQNPYGTLQLRTSGPLSSNWSSNDELSPVPIPIPQVTSPLRPPEHHRCSEDEEDISPDMDAQLSHLYSNITKGKPSLAISTSEDRKAFFRRLSTQISTDQRKSIINFYSPEGGYKTLVVSDSMLIRDVIEQLVCKSHVKHDTSWQLVQVQPDDNIERLIEDHENVLSICDNWPLNHNFKFEFRQNLRKVVIFQNPNIDPYHLAQQNGSLWIRRPNRTKWKQHHCFIYGGRLYYSIKKQSQDMKHARQLAEVNTFHIFFPTAVEQTKALYLAPTYYLLIIKKVYGSTLPKDTLCVCALDGNSYEKWYQALRFMSTSITELRRSYHLSVARCEKSKLNDMARPKSMRVIDASRSNDFVTQEASRLFSESWYHSEMDANNSEDILLKQTDGKDGWFLVRLSLNMFYISVIFCMKIHHYPITTVYVGDIRQFCLDDRKATFPSVSSLVKFYSNSETPAKVLGPLQGRLLMPLGRKVFQL